MKRTIMTGKNGFVYRALSDVKPLNEKQKRDLRLDILEHKRALNLELLNKGLSKFI